MYHALPAERWAYVLQNADSVTPEEVCRIFPDEKIAGVFEMTSEHLKQLARDIARQKYQRDGEARLIQARLEGEARGVVTDTKRSMLQAPVTPFHNQITMF